MIIDYSCYRIAYSFRIPIIRMNSLFFSLFFILYSLFSASLLLGWVGFILLIRSSAELCHAISNIHLFIYCHFALFRIESSRILRWGRIFSPRLMCAALKSCTAHCTLTLRWATETLHEIELMTPSLPLYAFICLYIPLYASMWIYMPLYACICLYKPMYAYVPISELKISISFAILGVIDIHTCFFSSQTKDIVYIHPYYS